MMFRKRTFSLPLLGLAALLCGPLSAFSQPPEFRDRDRGLTAPSALDAASRRAPVERRWRLGVNVQDTNTGSRITDLVINSPAHRAGLEVGDTIVAVNGYQVGLVNGQMYDCGDEFQRRADRRGYVTLLIWNFRDGSLSNRLVHLEPLVAFTAPPVTATFRGEISFRERIAFPRDAVVEVRLVSTGNDPLPVVLADQVITRPNGVPVPYQLSYDPRDLPARGQVILQAEIWVRGRLQWSGSEVIRRPHREGTQRQDLIVSPARDARPVR